MSTGKAEKCLAAMTEFYAKVFGKKWFIMLKDMGMPKSHCALVNSMVDRGRGVAEKLKGLNAESVHLKPQQGHSDENACVGEGSLDRLHCLKYNHGEFDHPINHRDGHGKMSYFLMDLSSLLPVLALDIQPSDFVLDMCASPGGKTLAIAMQLSEQGQLISNELNPKRRKRLYKVLDDYVPKSSGNQVKVTNIDGRSFGLTEPNAFNKILLDAPCSSDRHLIQENFRYSGWSVKKSHDFAKLQKQLLASAINSVQVGGTVVYSTCSLSPIENDDVIRSTLDDMNHSNGAKVETVDFSDTLNLKEFCVSDSTQYGLLIIPSKSRNWGPMYTCKMLRVS